MPFNPTRFRSFLVIIISLSLIISFLYFGEKNSNDSNFFSKKISRNYGGGPPIGVKISTPEWERENVFINSNIYLQQGGGYDIKNFNSISSTINLKPIKIVIFGDSHTWGNGNIDRYSTVPNMLQEKLNKKYGKGVFEVITLGANGASTYNFYDYFSINPVSKYTPDLLIYDYFNNDIDPSFNESLICNGLPQEECGSQKDGRLDPAYQACMHGEGDKFSSLIGKFKYKIPHTVKSSLTRYCASLYQKALKREKYNPVMAIHFPLKSPYFKTWEKAVYELKSILAPNKVAVVDIKDPSIDRESEDGMMKVFQGANYSVIPMSKTKSYVYSGKSGDFFTQDMYINPGNTHTASNVNNLYTDDIIDYIPSLISPERIKEATESLTEGGYERISLIKYFMPFFGVTNNSISPNESNISFQKVRDPNNVQKDQFGNILPFQYSNCMNLGYSNYIFTLDSSIKAGKITLTKLQSKLKPILGFYTYDADNRLTYQEVGSYREGNQIDLPSSNFVTSLVISFPDINKGCPYSEEIGAENFNFNIKYLP